MNLSILHVGLLTAGACTIALPILIHILLRRRRTPVAWGAMRFILEAYQQQRKRTRLEQILLLLCRCLLVACLAAALARPFIPTARANVTAGPQTLILLIDNSAASGALDGNRTALDEHLARAARQLAQLDGTRGDRVGVITLASPAEALVWPPSGDLGAVSRVLGTIESRASRCDLSGGLVLAKGNDDGSTASGASSGSGGDGSGAVSARWMILSEFRLGSLDTGSPPAATLLPRNTTISMTAAATTTLANVTIADVALLEPVILLGTGAEREEEMSPGPLRVTLVRSGALAAATSTVRVMIGAAGSAPGMIDAPDANATSTAINWAVGDRTQVVTVPTPRVKLSQIRQPVVAVQVDRDDLAIDNTFVLPITPRELMTVGFVAPAVESPLASLGTRAGVEGFSSADWLYLAIEPSAPVSGSAASANNIRRVWIEPSSLAATPLSDVDALIVAAPHALNDAAWGTIAAFLDRGGVVLVAPGGKTPVQVWSDAASRLLGAPLTMSREPRQWAGPASVMAPDPPASRADPLTLLRPELTQLLNPVSVGRQFVISPDPTVQALLTSVGKGPDGKEDAAPLLVSLDRVGAVRGRIYLFAAATVPDWTDLPARPLFVALIQELLRQGLGSSSTPLVQRAGTALMAPPGAATLNSLTVPGQTLAVSPRGGTLEPVRTQDVFSVFDQRGLVLGTLATVPDAAAANVDVQNAAAVRRAVAVAAGLTDEPQRVSVLGETGEPISTGSGQMSAERERQIQTNAQREADVASANHSRISMWLFALAAVLAVLDLLMGRWFSHASVRHTKSALDSRVVIDREDISAAPSAERAA